MMINLSGPGVTRWSRNAAGVWEFDATSSRNPYDISTWGSECARGMPYKDTGVTTDGAANQRRSISSGRKHRGSSSDDLAKRQARDAQ